MAGDSERSERGVKKELHIWLVADVEAGVERQKRCGENGNG